MLNLNFKETTNNFWCMSQAVFLLAKSGHPHVMFLGLGTKLDSFVLPAWPRAWHGSEEPEDVGSQQGRYCPLGVILQISEGVFGWHLRAQGKGAPGLQATVAWDLAVQKSSAGQETGRLSHAPFVYMKTYTSA